MSSELVFDTPASAAPAASERTLEFDAPAAGPEKLTREQELRRENLKRLVDVQGQPGYTARLKDSATMGLMRPISGLMRGVTGVFDPTSTFGERYRAGVGAEEDYLHLANKNTDPILGGAVDLIGGLAGGPGKALVGSTAKTVATEAPTKLQSIGRAAMTGAGQGAIEGAARNAEDVGSALTGAAAGGAVGGASSAVLGALTNRLGRVQEAKRAVGEASREGGSEALKDAGSEIYKRLDNAGIKFSDKETPKLVQGAVQKMADKGFNPELHKELVPVLDQIGKLQGKPATWTEIQNIRTMVSDAKASPDKRVRKMAGNLGNVVDDFIETAKPTMPPRSVGNVNVAEDAKAARDLWTRKSMAENAETLSTKGMRKASDPTAKLEKNFERYSDRIADPSKFTPEYSPERKALIDAIVQGDPKISSTGNFLSKVGNYGLGTGLGGAAIGLGTNKLFGENDLSNAGTTGSLGLLAAAAALKGGGSGLRRIAAERGAARVDDLIRNIVTGSTKKAPVQNIPREALAVLMANKAAKGAAGRFGGSLTDQNRGER